MTTIHELQLKLAEKNIEIKKKNLEITALQKKVWAGNRAESELARRNAELSEAEVKIAALTDRYVTLSAERNSLRQRLDSWRVRAEKAEAERDELNRKLLDVIEVAGSQYCELQAKLDDPYSEVNQKAVAWDRVEAHPIIGSLSSLPEGVSYAERVCKRLDQLADMEATINELQPAENRPEGAGSSRKENGSADSPTLDREAVEDIIYPRLNTGHFVDEKETVDAIMALAPAEGWQERLGTKPASEFLGGGWARWNSYPFARQKGDEILIGSAGDGVYEVNAAEAREFARCLLGAAERTEQDQRVEEVAERATEALVKTILDLFNVEDSDGAARAIVREERDAGWTPPNPSAEGDGLDRTTSGGRVESEA